MYVVAQPHRKPTKSYHPKVSGLPGAGKTCLAAVRLPSTWPATPRRQGDRQLSSPPASASAPSSPPAKVKTVELARTILTYVSHAREGKGQNQWGWGTGHRFDRQRGNIIRLYV